MPFEKKEKPRFTVKMTLAGNNWDDILNDLELKTAQLKSMAANEKERLEEYKKK